MCVWVCFIQMNVWIGTPLTLDGSLRIFRCNLGAAPGVPTDRRKGNDSRIFFACRVRTIT